MKFVFYIYIFFIRLFSITPFSILYIISDFFRFLFYYIIPYRKKIVLNNLRNSFPERSEREIRKLARAFYRNFSDILLENFKSYTLKKETLVKRMKFINPELMDEYFEQGREVISVGSHYCNWEWGIMSTALQLKHYSIGFYTPIRNKYIDKYTRINRNRYGTDLISKHKVRSAFRHGQDKPATYFFGGDQSPRNLKGTISMNFLNRETAFVTGIEFFARHYDLPVVYFDAQRVKRGYYTVKLEKLVEDPKSLPEGEIMQRYVQHMEKIILRKPENWLWSHNRWKSLGPGN